MLKNAVFVFSNCFLNGHINFFSPAQSDLDNHFTIDTLLFNDWSSHRGYNLKTGCTTTLAPPNHDLWKAAASADEVVFIGEDRLSGLLVYSMKDDRFVAI